MRAIILRIVAVFFANNVGDIVPEKIKSILVIRPDRIGDVVLTTVIIPALKFIFPQAQIYFLVSPYTKPLLENHPDVGDVFIEQDLVDRAKRFDLAIDAVGDYPLKTAWLARQWGKQSIGFDIRGRGVLFSHPVTLPHQQCHVVEETLLLLKSFGTSLPQCHPVLHVNASVQQRVIQTLAERGYDPSQHALICVHPGGYYTAQQWSLENYRDVIEAINQAYDVFIVILGHERDASSRFSWPSSDNVLVWMDQPLNDVVSMINASDFLIGNNSGMLHVAAALQKPTVSLLGTVTNRIRYSPWGENHTVLYPMYDYSAQDVLRHVAPMLNQWKRD